MVSTENRRVRQLLEDFVAALTPTDHEPTLDELRGCCDQWMTTNVPAPSELLTEQVNARGVPCLWASMPGTSTKRTIFYLHGGAYVVGSAVGWSGFAAALSQAADARVLLIDFRLAPEHPHPAALDDALTAYRWLVETTSPQAHTVVAGESAGGGLTLALLTALHDAGDDLPVAAVLISPWVDMTLAAASLDDRADLDRSRPVHIQGRARNERRRLSSGPRPEYAIGVTIVRRPGRPAPDAHPGWHQRRAPG